MNNLFSGFICNLFVGVVGHLGSLLRYLLVPEVIYECSGWVFNLTCEIFVPKTTGSGSVFDEVKYLPRLGNLRTGFSQHHQLLETS